MSLPGIAGMVAGAAASAGGGGAPIGLNVNNYRVKGLTSQGDSYFTLGELKFLSNAGDSSQPGSGTPSGSGTTTSGAAANLFDGNAGTIFAANPPSSAIFEYDFTAAQYIDAVRMTTRNDGFTTQAPGGFTVEAYVSGAWLEIYRQTGIASWTAGETRTYTMDTVVPSNTVLPVISGSPNQGVTLSITNGTWASGAAYSWFYQWNRDGSPIGGATSSTYLLTSSDVGCSITCTVTAWNAAGSATATSSAVTGLGPLGVQATQFRMRPTGTNDGTYCRLGEMKFLTASTDSAQPGSGTPVLTATTTGGSASDLFDGNVATTAYGTPVSTVVMGYTFSATQTINALRLQAMTEPTRAPNGFVVEAYLNGTWRLIYQASGLSSWSSNETRTYAFASAVPSWSVNPAIEGDANNGSQLSINLGTSTALSFEYQWKADGVAISAATNRYYVLTSSENGKVITCDVTGWNGAGYATVTTSGTSAVSSSAMSGASTQWRVINTVNATSYMAELTMHQSIGGSLDMNAVGGSASSSGSYDGNANGSYGWNNAFDRNNATYWYSNGTYPAYLEWTFPGAVRIQEVIISTESRGDVSSVTPTSMNVQYYNGSSWVTAWSISTSTWSANQTRTFHS